MLNYFWSAWQVATACLFPLLAGSRARYRYELIKDLKKEKNKKQNNDRIRVMHTGVALPPPSASVAAFTSSLKWQLWLRLCVVFLFFVFFSFSFLSFVILRFRFRLLFWFGNFEFCACRRFSKSRVLFNAFLHTWLAELFVTWTKSTAKGLGGCLYPYPCHSLSLCPSVGLSACHMIYF